MLQLEKLNRKYVEFPLPPGFLLLGQPMCHCSLLYLGESHTGHYNLKTGLYNTLVLSLMVYRFGTCILLVVYPEGSTSEHPSCISVFLLLPCLLLHSSFSIPSFPSSIPSYSSPPPPPPPSSPSSVTPASPSSLHLPPFVSPPPSTPSSSLS